MKGLLAQAQPGHSHGGPASTESTGFVMIGLVIVLATVALVLFALRRRARHTRPCPHCNVFIPGSAAVCPACARAVGHGRRAAAVSYQLSAIGRKNKNNKADS